MVESTQKKAAIAAKTNIRSIAKPTASKPIPGGTRAGVAGMNKDNECPVCL